MLSVSQELYPTIQTQPTELQNKRQFVKSKPNLLARDSYIAMSKCILGNLSTHEDNGG